MSMYTVGTILGLTLTVVAWGEIFRKAGYSFWMGLLGIIPVLPILWLFFDEWPIRRAANKVAPADRREAAIAHAYDELEKGGRLERQGRWEQALAAYQRVHEKSTDATARQDAGVAIRTLRERMAAEEESRRLNGGG